MSTVTIVLLVILIVLIGVLIGLYFFGKKTQKRQEEQQAQIQATKQTVSMLVIDKKRLPVKESGLPQMVIDQTPKLMRRSKLPIVKAKIVSISSQILYPYDRQSACATILRFEWIAIYISCNIPKSNICRHPITPSNPNFTAPAAAPASPFPRRSASPAPAAPP